MARFISFNVSINAADIGPYSERVFIDKSVFLFLKFCSM